MSKETIQAIEENIRESRKHVELGEALERLRENRDFKRLIQDGYFKDEAVRLVHTKAQPAHQKPESQAAILLQIDAIGNLNEYFRTVMHLAALARKSIGEDEASIEELNAEELTNGR